MIAVRELFKKTFELYQKRFLLICSIVAVNVPIALIMGIYAELYGRDSFKQAAGMWSMGIMGVILFIVGIIGAVIGLWAHISLIISIKERESTLTAKQFLTLGWVRWSQAFGAYLLGAIFILLGFIALIIPGILLSVWFAFALYIVVNEGITGMDALNKSRELVTGRWWKVFWRFAAMAGFIFLIAIVASPAAIFADMINIFFCMPFTVIYGYLLYEELKKPQIAPIG